MIAPSYDLCPAVTHVWQLSKSSHFLLGWRPSFDMVGLDALIVRSWNNSDRLRLMGQASPNESPTLAELSDATGSSIGLAACFRSVIAKSPRALGRCIPRRAR